MNDYKYSLAPYSGMKSRYRCPACQNKEKTFTPYIDNVTGEIIHPMVGRCSREIKCGYHYTPREYFINNEFLLEPSPVIRNLERSSIESKPKLTSYVSEELLHGSLKKHESNHFVTYLNSLFGTKITQTLIGKYYIGTSKKWLGANVFWQIDANLKIRTGKIMLYNPCTGKRVREPFTHVTWVHSELQLPEFKLTQCFFGEHLLRNNNRAVAIVESEKTAIISSIYIPEMIWLAAGSLNNLNVEKCSALNGRDVTFYPDLNGYEKWQAKVHELAKLAKFAKYKVSTILESNSSVADKSRGFDLADYFVRFNYLDFIDTP